MPLLTTVFFPEDREDPFLFFIEVLVSPDRFPFADEPEPVAFDFPDDFACVLLVALVFFCTELSLVKDGLDFFNLPSEFSKRLLNESNLEFFLVVFEVLL
jgi:hypothetical protein